MTSTAERIQTLLSDKNIILYDGDCIYCKKYTELIRVREALGSVKLVNLREQKEATRILRDAGVEPNEGMVFITGDKLYFGREAVHALALLSTPVGFLNKLQKRILQRESASRLLYPVLKFGRRVTLFARGKTLIG